MLLAGLVVEEDLALQKVREPRDFDDRRLGGFGVGGRRFEQVEGPPGVAAGGLGNEREAVVVEPEVARAEPPRDVVEGALDDPRDRLRRERLEDDDLAAGQERAVQLERRVLGRGADEDDVPGFDVREEDVLLGAVEPVDLVEKQDRALALTGAQTPRLLEDLAHLLDARRDGRVRQEERGRLRGDQARQGRLPDTRRPPEDEGRHAILGDRPPQEPVGADDGLRALDLVEGARPHAVGERRRSSQGAGLPESRGRVRIEEVRRHRAASRERWHSFEQTAIVSPPRCAGRASLRSIQVPQTGSRTISSSRGAGVRRPADIRPEERTA